MYGLPAHREVAGNLLTEPDDMEDLVDRSRLVSAFLDNGELRVACRAGGWVVVGRGEPRGLFSLRSQALVCRHDEVL